MPWLILVLTSLWLGYLWVEAQQVSIARAQLNHVIHVNGTRGKSTVCRLIEAGLRSGGIRVFCKTTGTDPVTIDTEGRETPIVRRGKANIKEQINILRCAAKQRTQVLVIECMALQPELQFVAQHRILQADIGVITNVRWDHADVMGTTLEEICDALCNTIPQRGLLFTGERRQVNRMSAAARRLESELITAYPGGDEPDFDFSENIALALAVCEYLGVNRQVALAGMAEFKRDPFALSLYRLGGNLWINGLSINDVESTCMVWERLRMEYRLESKKLIVLVNNRSDRGGRAKDMLRACLKLKPTEVWLMGASQGYMGFWLRKHHIPAKMIPQASKLNLTGLDGGSVIYAVGNIADEGRVLMARLKKEGTRIV